MPITVEDGTNVTNADGWADQPTFLQWQVDFQGAASARDVASQEAAIRRAVIYLDSLPWVGRKTHGRAQALSWPRSGASDASGDAIGDAEIPAELIRAQHMLAWAELQSPGVLNPAVNMANAKTLTKADVIAWTHTGAEGSSVDAHRTLVMGALDTIIGLLAEDVRDVKDYDTTYFGVFG